MTQLVTTSFVFGIDATVFNKTQTGANGIIRK